MSNPCDHPIHDPSTQVGSQVPPSQHQGRYDPRAEALPKNHQTVDYQPAGAYDYSSLFSGQNPEVCQKDHGFFT